MRGGRAHLKSQWSAVGDDPDQIMRQHRQRRRTRLVLELAELFDRVQSSFEDMLRAKWEIGRKLQREMAEEAYGDKVAFVVEIAGALKRSRSSVYECLRLAEKWPDSDAMLWTVRAHIDQQLSRFSDALERSEAQARIKTWRYVSHNVLPEKRAKAGRSPYRTCALAGVPGHVCGGEVRSVDMCGEALGILRDRLEAVNRR